MDGGSYINHCCCVLYAGLPEEQDFHNATVLKSALQRKGSHDHGRILADAVYRC
ncbi:hypothetical protein D3C86_2163710 [compost metagenome]